MASLHLSPSFFPCTSTVLNEAIPGPGNLLDGLFERKTATRHFLRPAKTRKHFCRNILCQCYSQCCSDEQMRRNQNIFALEMETLPSSTFVAWIRKRGNIQETFRKHFKSMFLQCSPNISSFTSHATYVEDTKHGSWNQKMLMKLPKNIFASARRQKCTQPWNHKILSILATALVYMHVLCT